MVKRTGYLVKIGLLAWLAVIGFDLFLHAGILAGLYSEPSPFLLSPEDAFRLIPLGYLSFLVLIILLIWLMPKLCIIGWKSGLVFGLKVGAIIWGALSLGLLSISTASPILLLGWFLGQTAELGLAGMVLGSGLAASRLRPLLIKVIILFVLTVALGVIIQNITGVYAAS
ncbi:hypothetical protein ACFLYF_03835 [Chloroflexota bacterium]